MTLEYNVSWIDDSQDWVDSVRGPLTRKFDPQEIDLKITPYENGMEIVDLLKASVVDLVIMDYGLPEIKGDELVRQIRANGNLTEIVFYSQDEGKANEFLAWDGIHSCHRDEAREKLKYVIERFIERSKSIAIMRGMIISEAIDVENLLTKIILKIFGDKADIVRDKILNRPLLDFEKKRMLVRSVLNDMISDARGPNGEPSARSELLTRKAKCLDGLKKEIIDQRNILAHSEKTVGSDGILSLKSINKSEGDIKFTNEWKNSVRTDIQKHISNLHELYEIF